MPWDIKNRDDGKFDVIDADGKPVNKEPFISIARAKAYLRALFANSPDAGSKSGRRIKENMAAVLRDLEVGIGKLRAWADYEDGETVEDEAASSSEAAAESEVSDVTGINAEQAKAAIETAVGSKALNFSYAKSLGLDIPDAEMVDRLAVKSIGVDTVRGYTYLWGDPDKTDLMSEYFTQATDFWDKRIPQTFRPLTYDHAQDDATKADPVIGQIMEWGDDDLGRWFEAQMAKSHKYRRVIDMLIENHLLGTSSDTVPQYIQREKRGKAIWLKQWPWFSSALTPTPCEPRLLGSVEFLKSIGVALPEMLEQQAWQTAAAKMRIQTLRLYQEV